MSLLSWFSSDKPQDATSTMPVPDSRNPDLPSRNQRMAHRDQLFGVIREAMLNADIQPTGFRFKVLSLDGRGEEFLVMVDLSDPSGGDILNLSHVERAIEDIALLRHGIVVKAVYWRHQGVARPASPPADEPDTVMLITGPAPLEADGRRRDTPTGFEDTHVNEDRRAGLSPTQDGEL